LVDRDETHLFIRFIIILVSVFTEVLILVVLVLELGLFKIVQLLKL